MEAEKRAMFTEVFDTLGVATLFPELADSIASSWGPAVVRRALRELPRVSVALHSHRSVLVIESVRLGRYDIGLCTETAAVKDLVQQPLLDEPLVFVHARLGARADRKRPLLTIEPTSATYKAVLPLLRAHAPSLLSGDILFVESFGAVVQMVRAGFGNGLVPLGLARAMGLPRGSHHEIPGVLRRVSLLTRKTVHQTAGFAALHQRLAKEVAAHFRAADGRTRGRPPRDRLSGDADA